jgi:hypothetical protein
MEAKGITKFNLIQYLYRAKQSRLDVKPSAKKELKKWKYTKIKNKRKVLSRVVQVRCLKEEEQFWTKTKKVNKI